MKNVLTQLAAIVGRKPSHVVMGGYGHRPATEAIFGGTTRSLLEESPVPLFLAH